MLIFAIVVVMNHRVCNSKVPKQVHEPMNVVLSKAVQYMKPDVCPLNSPIINEFIN